MVDDPIALDIKPAKYCVLPGKQLTYAVTCSNNREQDVTDLTIQTSNLPEGVDYVAGSATGRRVLQFSFPEYWNGTSTRCPRTARLSYAFTVQIQDPWPTNRPAQYFIHGYEKTYELGGLNLHEHPRPVVIGPLAISLEEPAAGAKPTRGNHVWVTGQVDVANGSAISAAGRQGQTAGDRPGLVYQTTGRFSTLRA